MTSLAQVAQALAGHTHFGKDTFGVAEQLFTRLREYCGFAQSVQKTTLQFALKCLNRVTNSGLRQMQFLRRFGEGTSARERDKGPQWSAIQRQLHLSGSAIGLMLM